mgnify:CR=1 FL=1
MSDAERQESREDRRQRQTREQFEALGRFVQSFEQMVDATRRGIALVSGISGKKGERIVYIRTLIKGRDGREPGRSITTANTGQYL